MTEKMNYLRSNDFILLSTDPASYYVLRVTDANPIVFDYSPLTQISGFLPLNAFPNPAQAPAYNSYIVDREELAMQEFTNMTNFLDSSVIKMNKKDTLLQIYMGISPSPLRVFRYYPSNDHLNDFLDGNLIHWGGRQQKYDIGYIDGFMSPKNAPTEEGEFYMLPTASMLFTFMNPMAVPAYPDFKFYINQMIVEPIHNTTLALNILQRKVPARIVNVGEFNKGFTPYDKIYGVDAIPLTATESDLQGAGY